MRAVLLAAIASMGLVGCVGDIDTSGGGGNGDGTGDGDGTGGGSGDGTGGGTGGTSSAMARAMYDDNVYPVMAAKCIGCHAAAGPVGNLSGFVTADVSTAHDTIVGFTSVVGNFAPTVAPVLLKVTAAGGHQGQTYTMVEAGAITDWLNQELIDRSGGGTGGGTGSGTGSGSGSGSSTPPPETPAQATLRVMNTWSGCMTLQDFDDANMAPAWGNMTAENNQRCSNCHAGGDGGFIATIDEPLFFQVVSSNKYYMLQYLTVKLDLADLSKSEMAINTQSFLGVSQGKDPHREHPRFNATTNNGMTALQNWYNRVKSDVTAAGAAGCGPSKLTN